MKVCFFPSDDFLINTSVLTIGMFDGVHLGHQKILKTLVEEAKKQEKLSVVVTFKDHPQHVLRPETKNTLKLITTLDEKIEVMGSLGIDEVVVLNFDEEMSERSSSWFIEEVVKKKCNADVLVLGYDHRFGRGREGGFEFLNQHKEKWGLKLIEIPRHDVDSNVVSSTAIRSFLSNADFESVSLYLGRDFNFSGIVEKGRALGRTIGFPTANLNVDQLKILPPTGVYAVRVKLNGNMFSGMMNIGFNPTVEGKGFSIEVNIFDFDQDIYGSKLVVIPVKRIRDEKKFENFDALKKQIESDKMNCQILLSELLLNKANQDDRY
ncbi:MAG: bifunctional riboflavin kinase/FAD synthetase [Cytophagales bacterium]